MVKRFELECDYSVQPFVWQWSEVGRYGFENQPCIEFPVMHRQEIHDSGRLHKLASMGAESFRLELTTSRARADDTNSMYHARSLGSFDMEMENEEDPVPTRKRIREFLLDEDNANFYRTDQVEDEEVDEDEQDRLAAIADEASKRQRQASKGLLDDQAEVSDREESSSLVFSVSE